VDVAGSAGVRAWCQQQLGAEPVEELFRTGHLSMVVGLRLANNRQVVIKARPPLERVAGCKAVQQALARAGFPCPPPLAGPHQLDGLLVTPRNCWPAGSRWRTRPTRPRCSPACWPSWSGWPHRPGRSHPWRPRRRRWAGTAKGAGCGPRPTLPPTLTATWGQTGWTRPQLGCGRGWPPSPIMELPDQRRCSPSPRTRRSSALMGRPGPDHAAREDDGVALLALRASPLLRPRCGDRRLPRCVFGSREQR
jgi:hypothetical protein